MHATIIKINLSSNGCCLTLHRELQINHLHYTMPSRLSSGTTILNNSGNSRMLSNMDKLIECSSQLCKRKKSICVLRLKIKEIVYYFFYGLLRVQGSLTNSLAMAVNVTLNRVFKRSIESRKDC